MILVNLFNGRINNVEIHIIFPLNCDYFASCLALAKKYPDILLSSNRLQLWVKLL
ncbi:hypothetical protein NSMM_190036 [Nitrosomonas mobilis]|uniref:Uncharacterized protein n=1 Tax=Nitrosomonas mobilis TaxID=51642 RepID=A0A1G5SDM9_9PROT|nr:hypothetical protein NSMM_190036 [Nitrosomonas mobilis]